MRYFFLLLLHKVVVVFHICLFRIIYHIYKIKSEDSQYYLVVDLISKKSILNLFVRVLKDQNTPQVNPFFDKRD